VNLTTQHTLSQQVRHYIIAFYQTQRNAFVVIVSLLIALYVLTVPDQAQDMIDAVIDTGICSWLFQFILLSAFIWSWVVYGSTRMILHISPAGIRLNQEADRLLRWLPKLGGLTPTLILVVAFWEPAHWHPYLLLMESGLMLILFLWVERCIPVFALPQAWHFSGRYTSLKQDFQELWAHPFGQLSLKSGFLLTGILLLVFSLHVELGIARGLRPTAVLIFGISLFTFWGSLLVYFNDYR